MQIAGIVKNSFVDYPSHISCVVFTPGCNMNCWYCHNRDLITQTDGIVSVEEVLNFLEKRKSFLDGVVITGGEPTMQSGLASFIKKVKAMGYKVKLDTNGSNTEMVKSLVADNLLDYIAMDIKAPLERYETITKVSDINEIKKSINYIMECGVDYEFRTTFEPNLTSEDIVLIVNLIKGAKNYALQQFYKPNYITKEMSPHLPEEFTELKEQLSGQVKNFIIRNL